MISAQQPLLLCVFGLQNAWIVTAGVFAAVVAWSSRADGLVDAAGLRLAKSVADRATPKSVSKSQSTVPRVIVETLRKVYFRKHPGYYLLVGPRGCGKTFAALSAAFEETTGLPYEGVLWVRANNGDDAVKHILRKLAPTGISGVTSWAFENMVASADLDTVRPVLEAAAKEYRRTHPTAPEDWVPTIIIELDRGLDPKDVGEVCRVAKLLTSEYSLASVVLVLSDAGTAGIPSDIARQVRTIPC